MKSSPTVDAATAELDKANVPYRVTWTSNHVHIHYGPEYQHLHVCSATPSDRRAPLNERAQIRRELRQHGLVVETEEKAREIVPVFLLDGAPSCYSHDLAQTFGKAHKDVLRAIDRVRSVCGDEFNQRNFAPIEQKDAKGRAQRAYRLTRDGFSLVAMGFTGAQATAWKVKFIEAFNAMEAELTRLVAPATDLSPIQAEMDALISMIGEVEARIPLAGQRPRQFPYWLSMSRMERRRFERRMRWMAA